MKQRGSSGTSLLLNGRVDLTSDEDPTDEDPTDEDGDTRLGDSTGVSVSLGEPGASIRRHTGSYYPKRYWELLPKEILGATTQRDTGSYYPKRYWELLPKEILGCLMGKWSLQGGDGGACKLLRWLLGDVIEVLERSWMAVMEIMPIDQRALGDREDLRGEGGFEEKRVSTEKVGLRKEDGLQGEGVSTEKVAFEEKGVSTEKVAFAEEGLRKEVWRFPCGHTSKGIGLYVADSLTGNHHQDGFTSLETLRGFYEGYHKGCRLLRRLPHRLKAAAKAAIKVVGFYEGCHIGCNGGCWLLRRLSHRLQAAVKAATKLQRSLLAHAKAAILLRRLKRSSLALAEAAIYVPSTKAAIKVVGFYEGFHKGCRLLRRLPGIGYSLKDKNQAKTDKTKHGNRQSVKSQSQRRGHLKWANPYPS
ncbi:hypothetical protein Tco_0988759 [Tanacetum coccineum]|uniref:Uncharacterized protein n=1 Tax=Tanacetum coccineum TaxID=301880 RepID=A0ABQ5ERX5_9ASTR